MIYNIIEYKEVMQTKNSAVLAAGQASGVAGSGSSNVGKIPGRSQKGAK